MFLLSTPGPCGHGTPSRGEFTGIPKEHMEKVTSPNCCPQMFPHWKSALQVYSVELSEGYIVDKEYAKVYLTCV